MKIDFQGTTFPALNVLIARWIPLEERGLLGSLIFAGICLSWKRIRLGKGKGNNFVQFFLLALLRIANRIYYWSFAFWFSSRQLHRILGNSILRFRRNRDRMGCPMDDFVLLRSRTSSIYFRERKSLLGWKSDLQSKGLIFYYFSAFLFLLLLILFIFLEKTITSLERSLYFCTTLGFNFCSNRTRLGFLHNGHWSSQIHAKCIRIRNSWGENCRVICSGFLYFIQHLGINITLFRMVSFRQFLT